MRKRVYIAYTGGTIGMKKVAGSYEPVASYFGERLASIPEFAHSELPEYVLHEYSPLLDSADMRPQHWQLIADDIAANYEAFDGFVVLHGTDTMAYTASALSFMLENLAKPVILTGSQIPLSELRNDARENLITALLIAAGAQPKEVCLYLNGTLLRGNRSTKISASGFDAFASPNCPPLGEVGVKISLDERLSMPAAAGRLKVQALAPVEVAALRLFPGMTATFLATVLRAPLQGLVLETYGAGNAPSYTELLEVVQAATARGVVIVNCTQCLQGRVAMSDYATGSALHRSGVVSGFDMTPEAALSKLIYLLSKNLTVAEVRERVQISLRGELTQATPAVKHTP